MKIGELTGQGSEFDAMLARARSLRLHHATLLEGPPGIGKSHAALELAAAILCTSADLARACGACAACRKVESGAHPDFHLLAPPEDKLVIPVDAVRAVQSTMTLRPVEGRARVVSIDPADRLNEQGQNALLKTLEEPSDGTYLILAAARPEALLPTVRSRVARYRLRPLDAGRLAALCNTAELDPALREFAFESALGSVGMAREFCATTPLDGIVANVVAGRSTPTSAVRAALDDVEGRFASEQRARELLRWCAARCHLGVQESICSLAQGPQQTYADAVDPWIRAAEAVFAADADLATEIPVPQVLTELFLRWSEIFVGNAASRFA